jgi:hypothetical protein
MGDESRSYEYPDRTGEGTTQELPSHIQVVYEDALANIMFLKQQQWVTTNYTILIYAAIFAIANLIPLYDWEIHVLAGFVMSSFFVSNVILDRMQRSLSKFRSRLIFINSVFLLMKRE